MANNTKLYDVYDWNDQLVCGDIGEEEAAKIMLTYDGYDFEIKYDAEWDPEYPAYLLYIKSPSGRITPYKDGYRYESLDEIWGSIVMNGHNGLWARD